MAFVSRSCSKGRRGCTKNRPFGTSLARVSSARLTLTVGGAPWPPTAVAFAHAHALIIHWMKLQRHGSLVAV
jgi:hypothetical protein